MQREKSKVYMAYRAEDFILYFFSLIVFGAISIAALQSHWQLISIFLSLIFLLIFFVFKHGIRIDFSSLLLILKETVFYPRFFLKELLGDVWPLVPVIASYFLALAAEAIFSSKLEGSFWASPFPYLILFYLHFGIISLYRTVILFAHIKKYVLVRSILEISAWKLQLQKIHIIFHIIHSYITGLLCHLGIILLPLAFWRFTSPTYFREIAIIFFYIILQGYWLKGLLKKNIAFEGAASLNNLNAYFKWFGRNHTSSHGSQYYFTVFHGHHHDAIPCSLLASTGTGLIEGVHRSLARLHLLHSVNLFVPLKLTATLIFDMTQHQYIPGVYPYSKVTVALQNHHALHHYFSLLPLQISAMPYIQADMDKGYEFANPKAQWYVNLVTQYENLDPTLAAAFTNQIPLENFYTGKYSTLKGKIIALIAGIFVAYS